MIISQKYLKKLKVTLAIQGSGSKLKLASYLEAKPSEVSLLINTGYISKKKYEKLINYLSEKK